MIWNKTTITTCQQIHTHIVLSFRVGCRPESHSFHSSAAKWIIWKIIKITPRIILNKVQISIKYRKILSTQKYVEKICKLILSQNSQFFSLLTLFFLLSCSQKLGKIRKELFFSFFFIKIYFIFFEFVLKKILEILIVFLKILRTDKNLTILRKILRFQEKSSDLAALFHSVRCLN